MANPVTHFEIHSLDSKRAQGFYRDVFGWSIDVDPKFNYGMIDTKMKGKGINGGIGASQTGHNWVTFYAETPDLDATLAKVARAGGKTVMPPANIGPVTMAMFTDPDGNVIGLVKSGSMQPPKPRKATAKRAPAKTARKPARRTARRR